MSNLISGILGGVIGIVIACITYIVGPCQTEKFRLKRRLAESYLAPFHEWCSYLYGELLEFYQRYVERKDYSHISDLQIIEDYRCLHNSLKDSCKWIGKIKKEAIKKSITDLSDIVDCFWHCLENSYSKELPTADDEVFETHIKKLRRKRRKKIAQKICHHLEKENQSYLKVKIPGILDYLKKKIP